MKSTSSFDTYLFEKLKDPDFKDGFDKEWMALKQEYEAAVLKETRRVCPNAAHVAAV
jgi:hypothetical protein